jgi:hypothetical protein
MLSEAQRHSSLTFAENVALASLICRAAADPQENDPLSSSACQDPGRVLSAEQEADLTSSFAFLSGISDKPTDVVATCVEEPSDGKGIRVVVAVNKERPGSGNDILARIESGIQRIFRYLSCANSGALSQV